MKYIMKLNPKYFEYMKNGTKRIEIRLNDEKRKNIKIGDEIVFQKEPELKDEVSTQIVNLIIKRNFKELIENLDIRDAIIKTEFENIDIIPSASELSGAEIELANEKDREFKLRNSLYKIKDQYDYIFIDCPPSLGMLTINCLTAVNSVLIPIQCEYYALEGVSQLMSTYQLVKKRLNPDIEIQGVVLSMFDGRANLSIQVVEEVKKYFKGSVYTTLIPRNVRLAEAPSYGKPVIYYDTRCKGTEAYKELAEEFIELEEDVI